MAKMLKALIVDDSHLICWGLATVLSREKFHVTTAHDGKDALAGIAAGTYDLVILDVNLPDMDWLDVLAELRMASPGTEVVIMAADSRGSMKIQAMEKGASQFLEKPFDLRELSDIVRKVFAAGVKQQERVTL